MAGTPKAPEAPKAPEKLDAAALDQVTGGAAMLYGGGPPPMLGDPVFTPLGDRPQDPSLTLGIGAADAEATLPGGA